MMGLDVICMDKFIKKYLWVGVPGICGFFIFYIIPFLITIYYSFIENTFTKEFVGVSNYIKLFNNEFFRLAMVNTFQFTFISVPLVVLGAFVCALIMNKFVERFRIVRASIFIPLLVPSCSIVIIWSILFGQKSILVKEILNISIIDESQFFKIPLLLLFMWKYTGYNIILFIAGLIQIPKQLYEAAMLDGAGMIKRTLYITIPMLIPTIFFVLIISVVNSLKIFKEAYLLYGQYPKKSIYFMQHYMNNHFQKLNYQNIATSAVIFTSIIFLFIMVGYIFENKMHKGTHRL